MTAAFAIQAVAVGASVAAFPVFMASIEDAFGASRAATSWGISSLLVCAALLAPFVGRGVDRGSPRKLMVAGALMMTAGLAGISAATSFAAAAVLWVALVGGGQALFGSLTAMTVLANWFVARRSTMIAIAAMGTTFGGALSPPLCEFLIGAYGWRTAAALLGAGVCLLGVPIVLLGIVKRPEDIGAFPDGAERAPEVASPSVQSQSGSLRDIVAVPRFWLIAAAFTLMNGSAIAFLTHMLPIAEERGIEREIAVLILTINAVATAGGKLLFGLLTDRIGVRSATLIAATLSGVSWIGLAFSAGAGPFIASAAVLSVALGCVIPCSAGFIAALYGRERFGQASGTLSLARLGGTLVLPPLVGILYDAHGGYDVALQLLVAVTLVPVALFSLVRV